MKWSSPTGLSSWRVPTAKESTFYSPRKDEIVRFYIPFNSHVKGRKGAQRGEREELELGREGLVRF